MLRTFVRKAVMKMYEPAKKKKSRTLGNKNTQGDKGYTTTGKEMAKLIISLLLRWYEVVERIQKRIIPKLQTDTLPRDRQKWRNIVSEAKVNNSL